LSGAAREAVSLGCVLVKSLDRPFNRLCYGAACPIDAASDAASCYAALSRLIALDDAAFRARQACIRDWAAAHLDYSHQIPKLWNILAELAYVGRLQRRAA
jgi:hypothetical protein